MKLLSLTCNHCGAPIEVPRKTRFLTCNYCESRLEVREEGNAYFTNVLEALREKTDDLATDVEALQLKNQLLQLDQNWTRTKERHMVRGQDGTMHLPTKAGAIVGAVAVAAVVGVGALMVAPHFGGFALGGGALIIVLASLAFLGQFARASAYDADRSRYHRRRRQLTSQLRELERKRRE